MLVSSHFCAMGVEGGDVVCFELNRPIVPVTSTSAGALYAGLYGVPVVQRYVDCENALAQASTFKLKHWDRDGAAANDRLVQFMQEKLHEDCSQVSMESATRPLALAL